MYQVGFAQIDFDPLVGIVFLGDPEGLVCCSNDFTNNLLSLTSYENARKATVAGQVRQKLGPSCYGWHHRKV